MLGQLFECLWAGIKLGFQAIFSALPIYNQLSNIPQDIVCMALGIPTVLATIIVFFIRTYKIITRHN